MKKAPKATEKDRLSMKPLTPEQALGGFMKVDPEKVKERKRCSCEKWPIRGGKPDPKFPDIIRGVRVDRDVIDPECAVHKHLLKAGE